MTPVAQTTNDLLSGYARELILLCGKDGVGKSSAVVSLASFVATMWPDAAFYVIDTENKFGSAVRAFDKQAPHNIHYYKVDDMNAITAVTAEIMAKYVPGDWLAVESMSRVWERAQDLAYKAIAGVGKIEYLQAAEGAKVGSVVKKGSPIPSPDDFWNIAKGAHEGAFLSLITAATDINAILTTTVSKPRDDARSKIKENVDRKALRIEVGIDVGIDGTPRLPYYAETLAMLHLNGGQVSCQILRDNNSKRGVEAEGGTRPEFIVPDKLSFASTFWQECRL